MTQNCSDMELLCEQVTKRESFVEMIEESNLTLSKSLAYDHQFDIFGGDCILSFISYLIL